MNTLIFRIIFLFCVYAVTLTVSWSLISVIQFVLYLILKPFSVYIYRKVNYYLTYSMYCQLFFITTWFTKLDMRIHVHPEDLKYFGKEHAWVIMNHRYEVDWLFLLTFADQSHVAGNFKTYTKRLVQYIPFAGWSFYMSDFIFLERSFNKDKEYIVGKIAELLSYSDPIWMLLFPEGTRYTKSKHEASMKFAQERKLPLLKHHLIPRYKGFLISLPIFRNKLNAIYDAVVSVDPKDEIKLTTKNVLLGKNIKVNLYVKRIPMEQVPQAEEEAVRFLNDMFVEKDKLQENFFDTGSYSMISGEGCIEKDKIKKNYIVLIITLAWMIVVVPPIWYYLIVTFFTTKYTAIGISTGLLIFFISLWNVLLINEVEER